MKQFSFEKKIMENVANKMTANVSVSPCKMCWQHTWYINDILIKMKQFSFEKKIM